MGLFFCGTYITSSQQIKPEAEQPPRDPGDNLCLPELPKEPHLTLMVFPSRLREIPHAVSRQKPDRGQEPVVALGCTNVCFEIQTFAVTPDLHLIAEAVKQISVSTTSHFSDFSVCNIAGVNTKEVQKIV